MYDSSDDEAPNAAAQAQTKSSMKSIFESDRRAKLSGESNERSLQYDGGKATREATSQAVAAAGGSGSGGTNQVAKQAMAQTYKGEQLLGACAVVLMASTINKHLITIVNKERKPVGRVPVTADIQFLQNTSDGHYATLYDPQIQAHWTFTFRTPAECTTFVVGVLTLHHYMMLGEGPRQNFLDLTENLGGERPRKGDLVTISMKVWLLARTGSTSAFCTGKDIEEIAENAPRKCQLGLGKLMNGVEESLLASTVGTKRLLFLSGKKCKCARSLGNPEIGPQDTVVVILHLLACEQGETALPDLGLDDGFGVTKKEPGTGSHAKKRRDLSPEITPLQIEAPQAPTAPLAPAAPTPVAAAVVDPTQQLMQTLLLQQLQRQNEASQPKVEGADTKQSTIFVERSLDRLHQQLSGLYEKIDRLDLGKHLADNNANIERMVKKAVGKMPVADLDIADMSKDRDQLLAMIEQLKGREQDTIDKYHKALEQLGDHKEKTSALKNDLIIQQTASEKTIKELQSRSRLEGVDHEVKHRRELDRVKEESFKEGREAGFKDGYNAGKIDAMTIAGSATTEELRRMLEQKEVSIVDLQTKITKMESTHYEERRSHGDQVNSMQSMISRLERREEQRAKDLMDTATKTGKAMKRIMNETYSSIEEQVYAMNEERVNTEEVLQLILMTVKEESRSAIDKFKKEAAERASQPLTSYDDDDVPLVIAARDQPPAPPTQTQTAAFLASAPEVLSSSFPPPPPPAAPSTAAGDYQYSTLPPEVLSGTDAAVPASVVPPYTAPYTGHVDPAPYTTTTMTAAPVEDVGAPLAGSRTAQSETLATTMPTGSSGGLAAFLAGSVDPSPVSNIPSGHTAPLPSNLDWMMNGGGGLDGDAGGAPPLVKDFDTLVPPPVLTTATLDTHAVLADVPPSTMMPVDNPANVEYATTSPPEIDLSVLEVEAPALDMSNMDFDGHTAPPPAVNYASGISNGQNGNEYAEEEDDRSPTPPVVLDEDAPTASAPVPPTRPVHPNAAAVAAAGNNSSFELEDDTTEDEAPVPTRRPAPKPKQRSGQFLTDSDED